MSQIQLKRLSQSWPKKAGGKSRIMSKQPTDGSRPKRVYSFTIGSSRRGDLIGAVIERGPAGMGVIFVFLLLVFGLSIWYQHGMFWYESLLFLFPVLIGHWHYLGLVVEIRLNPEHLSLRRLVKFRSIPWEQIRRVRIYSLTTMGVTYVWIKGDSYLPLAFFPLASGYPPETWKELTRLVEDLKQRVPVKHTM